jgi:FAD/FMN-containing dehydrogenase
VDIFGDTQHPNTYTMAVRFEMGTEAIEAQTATLLAMVAEIQGNTVQATQQLEGDAETQFWAQTSSPSEAVNVITDGHPQGASLLYQRESVDTTHTVLTLKASLLPTEVAHWLTEVEQVCQQQQLHARWRAHAGHGLVSVQLSGDDTMLTSAVQTLRQTAHEHQGSLVVTDAPPKLAQQIDVWGPVPALHVMQNLKARFDPHNILNPGRFVGGL